MTLFVFGLGYSARAIARRWRGQTAGTTRTSDNRDVLEARGFTATVFDGAPAPDLFGYLASATHMVLSAAPDTDGDPVIHAIPDLLERTRKLEWIGYLSTVGVYGDFQGRWISENTAPEPVSERGRWRVAAERQWMQLARDRNIPLAIFRLAGIYGPGRSVFEKLQSGKSRRIIKPGQVFNRIHHEDIAQIVCAAADRGASGVFNVADDEPAPPQTVITHAARMLDMEPPVEEPFETAVMTPMARSFYLGNKRCGNARLKKDLGVSLRYPTYREGLAAVFKKIGAEPV